MASRKKISLGIASHWGQRENGSRTQEGEVDCRVQRLVAVAPVLQLRKQFSREGRQSSGGRVCW